MNHLIPTTLPARPTCVIVPDATRPIDYLKTVRPLLEALCAGGSQVRILVALGLHRPMTDAELAPLEGAAAGLGVAIEQHDARGDLVDLGVAVGLPDSAPTNLPITLNRRLVEAERIICVGTVEPHQYAGFSGGIKAIAIGCAGEATITAMHGLSLLRDEGTRLSGLEDNPFQACLWRIVHSLNDVLGMQIVPTGGSKEPSFFGEIKEAFESACQVARREFFETFDEKVDWLHLPVPAVKASNFYQASRAATYAALVDGPAIRDGGTIIVEAACPEGIGTGTGERACAEAMLRGRDALLDELKAGTAQTRGGQQRAYVLARTCARYRVALVGAPTMPELEAMGIEQFESLESATADLGLRGRPAARVDNIFRAIPTMS